MWLPALGLATGLSTPPAMRAEASFSPVIRELHFSPDGRYMFAQDDAKITVLAARPFTILFRIPAGDVSDAQFTPDSKDIVLMRGQVPTVQGSLETGSTQLVRLRGALYVERWSIAGHTRADVQGVPVNACYMKRLSPDGRYVACLDPVGTLWLLDVHTAQVVFERKRWCTEGFDGLGDGPGVSWVFVDPFKARADFSSDGRFLVAAPSFSSVGLGLDVITWNLQTAKSMGYHGDLARLREGDPEFVFVAPDQLLISEMFWARHGFVKAHLAAFPSGKKLARPKLPAGPLFRAADPAYVIVCRLPQGQAAGGACWPPDSKTAPADRQAVAAEITTGDVITNGTPALDVYHNYYIAESSQGEVGLYERGKGLQAKIALHEKGSQ